MYDLLIRGGRVLDGTGAPWFAADVALVGERVVAMGHLADREAVREIDAAGRFVTPGFVDEHGHSDVTLLVDPRAQSAVRQGITSLAVGACGMSAAPVREASRDAYRRATPVFSFEGYEWSWAGMGEYLEALRARRPSVNVVALAGHLPLRVSVMGQATRPADEGERAEMRTMLAEALAEGARGFSTGLTYESTVFADTEEILEIAKALGPHGWAYHTHMRSYGRSRAQALAEALEVAEGAGVPLVVSHLYPSGRDYWGEAGQIVEWVERARDRGAEVGYDVTPWLRGGGPVGQSFPPWAREGGLEGTLEVIRDPVRRGRLARELEEGGDWAGWIRPEWEEWLVCRAGKLEHREWLGRTVAEIAAERGQAPAETALLMYLEDRGQYWVAPRTKCDEDIDLLLRHPSGVPTCDGFALAPEGPLAYQDRPNSYGSFPRVLGRYVRERGVLTWEQAVQKMTSIPAGRLGLWDRGVLRPGMAADVVIFDPATVVERADYQRPQEYPEGVEWVIVNGEVTVSPDGHTGARVGQVV